MWEYEYNDELKHYGVLGMRWGVRRSAAKLRAKSSRLDRKNEKLQNKYVKTNMKAANKRNKMYGLFTSKEKAERLEFEASKLEARGKKYLAKMMKNEEKKSVFDNTAKALESGKVLAGNKFVMKYEQETIKRQLD